MNHTHKTACQTGKTWLHALVLTAALVQAGSAMASTLAYWRFEGDGTTTPIAGTSVVEGTNGRASASTGVGIRVKDVSGNGNDVWAWNTTWAGTTYRAAVPAASIPQTGATNSFSVQNTSTYPAMFTWSKYSTPKLDIETVTPKTWTIEASINMTSTSGYQTFVGRDGTAVYATDKSDAPLYFQVAGGTLCIKFADMGGHFYSVCDVSGTLSTGKWYNVAAVSDGASLRLYRDSGSGYKLVGQGALTAGDTRLAYAATASTTSGDTQWGWTLGRGRYSTSTLQTDGHTDRFMGYLDEVRISDAALKPSQFLFSTPDTSTPVSKAGQVNLIVMPDTQEYSRYKPAIYNAQTQWIADNSDRLGISFTLHLGDIVDQQSVTSQWTAARSAMAIVENAGKPYSILPGNHDVVNSGYWDDNRTAANEKYLTYFGPSHAIVNTKTLGGRDAKGYSEYHVIEVQGQKFLILALGWNATTSTLNWAQNVIQTLNLPTILTNHESLDVAADESTAVWTDYGNYVWSTLVNNNNQIFLMINGHHHGTAYTYRTNAAGNQVLAMVIDYQSDYQGGNGYMRLLQLDFANSKVNAMDFSPYVLNKIQNGESLTYLDNVIRTLPTQTFTTAFSLSSRIAGINGSTPSFNSAGTVDAYTTLFDELYPHESAAPSLSYESAKDDNDYPANADTIAHWRFDGFANGSPVPAGVPLSLDITGNGNDLTRVNANSPAATALVFSNSYHPGSASKGSVCSIGGGRNSAPGAYLQTVEGAPAGLESFPNGYTFEAFYKLAPAWNADTNRWSGIIARVETGADVGMSDGDASESAAGLDVSDLREMQWATYPNNMTAMHTSWSFAVARSTWHHVAAVNDGGTIKIYVDGITDMRNDDATTAIGLAAGSVGRGWLIGASHYNHSPYIFNGCIGEIRLTAHALTPAEFLYNRAE